MNDSADTGEALAWTDLLQHRVGFGCRSDIVALNCGVHESNTDSVCVEESGRICSPPNDHLKIINSLPLQAIGFVTDAAATPLTRPYGMPR